MTGSLCVALVVLLFWPASLDYSIIKKSATIIPITQNSRNSAETYSWLKVLAETASQTRKAMNWSVDPEPANIAKKVPWSLRRTALRGLLSTCVVAMWFALATTQSANGSLRMPLNVDPTQGGHGRALQTGGAGFCDSLTATTNCTCTAVPDKKSLGQEIGEWIAILVLLFLSACFSGLNLGLLSLDLSGLEIVANGSDETNSRYARAIIPVRKHHNWLLTTLLLGNVMVNSLISILLADKTSGVIGFVVSTAAIVLLGEVFPQAISSRHPLYVGYHSLYLVYVFMALLYVIARPLSLLLDKMLGAPIGTIYAHEEFAHLVEMHRAAGALDEDQTKIMKGALDFKHASVEECMTPIANLYSLEVDDVIDKKKLKEIFTSGYSRVPVHSKNKEKTVGMLITKDLILVDPRQARTVGEIAEIFERTPLFFKPSTSLGRALALFKLGKSHCAVVEETDETGYKRTVGFVTLEDILEELLDSEIQDETEDVVHQRFITLDPSFAEKNDVPVEKKTSFNPWRRKGGQSPEIVTEAARKVAKLGSIHPEEEVPSNHGQVQPKKKTTVIRKLTPVNRLSRVLADVTNVLGEKLQKLVKDRMFLTSLGLSLSGTESLSKISIHLNGEIDIGSVTLTSPWYAPVRDSYAASFMVSAVPRVEEDDIQHNGVSRKIIFNSEDALREPALANDVVHPVLKKTASDPNMGTPTPPNLSTQSLTTLRGLGRESVSSDEAELEDAPPPRDNHSQPRLRSKSIDQFD